MLKSQILLKKILKKKNCTLLGNSLKRAQQPFIYQENAN